VVTAFVSCNSDSTTPAHDTNSSALERVLRIYHSFSCSSDSTTPDHDTNSSALERVLWIYPLPTLSPTFTGNMQLQQRHHHPSPRHHLERPGMHRPLCGYEHLIHQLYHAHSWKYAVATATAPLRPTTPGMHIINILWTISIMHIHGKHAVATATAPP